MSRAFDWIGDELCSLDGLRRTRSVRSTAQSLQVTIDGHELINFGSNDYLGLSADERLIRAGMSVTPHVGVGSGASPLISGRGSLHDELELKIAEFERTDAALLFPSGFAANATTIPALVGRDDVIYSDQKNHASIIDGCRLSGARIERYYHADVNDLKERISRDKASPPSTYRHGWSF